MSWLSRLFSPLARLFGRRPASRRFEPLDLAGAQTADIFVSDAGTFTLPTGAEPPPPPPAAPPPAEFPPLPEGAASVEVEEGEDAFEEEELAADALADSEAELDERPDLDVIVAERQAGLGDARQEAERLAMAGEQRVRLTDPAGPGTLAETLARLEREGRVVGTLQEDDGEPVLVYAPVGPPGAPPPTAY